MVAVGEGLFLVRLLRCLFGRSLCYSFVVLIVVLVVVFVNNNIACGVFFKVAVNIHKAYMNNKFFINKKSNESELKLYNRLKNQKHYSKTVFGDIDSNLGKKRENECSPKGGEQDRILHTKLRSRCVTGPPSSNVSTGIIVGIDFVV